MSTVTWRGYKDVYHSVSHKRMNPFIKSEWYRVGLEFSSFVSSRNAEPEDFFCIKVLQLICYITIIKMEE